MKNTLFKRLAAILPVAVLATAPVTASVTVSVDAGTLTSHTGSDLSDGMLLLLIASPTGVFAPITAGSFVSGDNIIVGSSTAVTGAFAMNDSASGIAGETFNALSFNYGVGSTNDSVPTTDSSFVAGDKLALRWFDDFTLTQFEAGQTPTQGYYGTYTTLGSSNPDGGVGWVGPADGGAYTGQDGLNFFTLSDSGTQLNVEGQALVPLAPEPSTYALLGAGMLLLAGWGLRRRMAGTTFEA